MGDLRREDEQKLKALTDLCQCVGRWNLPEDDQLCMLYLEDRYSHFLDEGMRKLLNACSSVKLKGTRYLSRCTTGVDLCGRNLDVQTVLSTGKHTSTDSDDGDVVDSSKASSKEGFLESPFQESGVLWTWVLNNLVVGGVPHAAPREHGAGHLLELRRQCVERGVSVLCVVSCLEVGESIPSGFAILRDWEQVAEVGNYYSVPFIPHAKQENLPEAGNEVFEELLSVCNSVYRVLHASTAGERNSRQRGSFSPLCLLLGGERQTSETIGKQRAVYVMCKTGQTRAWVFAMAYLISQLGMEYAEADQHLRKLRAFKPGPAQIEWVLKFSVFIATPRSVKKSLEEDAYRKLLAQVLSLDPSYRERLIRDLEKLT